MQGSRKTQEDLALSIFPHCHPVLVMSSLMVFHRTQCHVGRKGQGGKKGSFFVLFFFSLSGRTIF